MELHRGAVAAKERETQISLNQLAQKNASDIAVLEHEKFVFFSFNPLNKLMLMKSEHFRHLAELNLSNVQSRHQEQDKVFAAQSDDFNEGIRRADAVAYGLRTELDAMK